MSEAKGLVPLLVPRATGFLYACFLRSLEEAGARSVQGEAEGGAQRQSSLAVRLDSHTDLSGGRLRGHAGAGVDATRVGRGRHVPSARMDLAHPFDSVCARPLASTGR